MSKSLVLVGEGHGEASALSELARKILRDKKNETLYVDKQVIRAHNALGLVTWDKQKNTTDCSKWIKTIGIARTRRDLGAVLAIFDGDAKSFPAGSQKPFCPATAAKEMALAAADAGAGKIFSLAVVFACVEYETWLIAGVESLAGQKLEDGRLALPARATFSTGDPESHGKGWLEKNCQGYRPTRDQKTLTGLLDLNVVRAKKLRSFTRLEHAIDQLLVAVQSGTHISTPA